MTTGFSTIIVSRIVVRGSVLQSDEKVTVMNARSMLIPTAPLRIPRLHSGKLGICSLQWPVVDNNEDLRNYILYCVLISAKAQRMYLYRG